MTQADTSHLRPNTSRQVTLSLFRGDASGGEFVDYTVEMDEGQVVLDVVHTVQATQAADLAVRWNCKAGKCGSCSAEVNGKPCLMCMTRMNTLDVSQPISVAPIKTFPLIRDLVTDVSFNFEAAKRIPAFAPRPPDAADGSYRMMQQDIERGQEFRKCIE
jgi:succinate dehydrogenase / fumarate reductase iron-sulfur subunit